jgi:hypothetical protein
MPLFGFPTIRWGTPGSNVTVPEVIAEDAVLWSALEQPSLATRFVRIFPQKIRTDLGQNFIPRIVTQYPWHVQDGNRIYIVSTITEP